MLGFTSQRHPSARIVHLNPNAADPVQLLRRLAQTGTEPGQPLPCLLIDCRTVDCLRTHGVGYFIDQMLLIRRTGAGVLLHNVEPPLRRALHLLRLDQVFELTPPAPAAA